MILWIVLYCMQLKINQYQSDGNISPTHEQIQEKSKKKISNPLYNARPLKSLSVSQMWEHYWITLQHVLLVFPKSSRQGSQGSKNIREGKRYSSHSYFYFIVYICTNLQNLQNREGGPKMEATIW